MTIQDLVKVKVSSCSKCLSFLYAVPCVVDEDLAVYLKEDFGKPIYPLGPTALLKTEGAAGCYVESRIGSKVVKLVLPKSYQSKDFKDIDEKYWFEEALFDWVAKKCGIKVQE